MANKKGQEQAPRMRYCNHCKKETDCQNELHVGKKTGWKERCKTCKNIASDPPKVTA